MPSIRSVTSGSPQRRRVQRMPLPQATPKLHSKISSFITRRARKRHRRALTLIFSSTSKRRTRTRSRNSTISRNTIALPSSTTTRSFVSSQDPRKATRRRNGLISCAQSSGTRRCSRLWPSHKVARKRAKRVDRVPLERGPPNRVQQITKHPCQLRRLILRFHRRLRWRPILPPPVNRCCLCRSRVQVRIHLPLPAPRPLPKRPPHRRLESLTCDSILPRLKWLSWLSCRAGKAILPS